MISSKKKKRVKCNNILDKFCTLGLHFIPLWGANKSFHMLLYAIHVRSCQFVFLKYRQTSIPAICGRGWIKSVSVLYTEPRKWIGFGGGSSQVEFLFHASLLQCVLIFCIESARGERPTAFFPMVKCTIQHWILNIIVTVRIRVNNLMKSL